MIITSINADIRTAPQGYTMVAAFSDDLNCGVGIPRVMNEMFGITFREDVIKKFNSGNIAKLDNLYMLFVKHTSYDAPDWDRFTEALRNFKKKCIKNKINKIAMPKICCGKNGFSWIDVEIVLEDILGSLDIDIIVYDLES